MKCENCGLEWEPDDTGPPEKRLIDFTGECEQCGSETVVMLRCPNCPVLEVETARMSTPAGRLLERVLDLDFDTKHFRIDWSDITAEEAMALKILEQERAKYERESAVRTREEAEMQQRMNQLKNRQARTDG